MFEHSRWDKEVAWTISWALSNSLALCGLVQKELRTIMNFDALWNAMHGAGLAGPKMESGCSTTEAFCSWNLRIWWVSHANKILVLPENLSPAWKTCRVGLLWCCTWDQRCNSADTAPFIIDVCHSYTELFCSGIEYVCLLQVCFWYSNRNIILFHGCLDTRMQECSPKH